MATYYVTVDGNDANDGLTSATAWKTLAKPSETLFAPNSEILLKCGDIFHDRLRPSYGPLTISCYGDRSLGLPQIRGSYLKTNTTDWTLVDANRNIWKTYNWKSTSAGPNLVYNSNFSTGSTSGWAFFTTDVANIAMGVVDDSLNPGNKALALQITNSGQGIASILFYSTSAFTCTKDHVYKISFYARCTSGATSATIYGTSIQQNGATGYSLIQREATTHPLTMTSAWTYNEQYIAVSATEPGSRVVFGFGNWQTSAGFPTSGLTFLLDEIKVQDVGIDQDHYDNVKHDVGQVWMDDHLYGYKFTNVSAVSAANGVAISATDLLGRDGDFCSDINAWDCYVVSPINPALRNAEIVTGYQGVLLAVNHITLSALDVNKVGGNAFNLHNSSGCKIYNCKISNIGGGNLYYDDGSGRILRQGNAVNCFEGVQDLHVKDNHMFNCYDVACTPQGNGENYLQKNIVFERNVIHNNEQTYEFWGKKASAKMIDLLFIDNFCADAGDSWSKDIRPDKKGVHILQYDNYTYLSGCVVSGNTFAQWRDAYKLEQLPINYTSGLKFHDNILASKPSDPVLYQIVDLDPLTVDIRYTVSSVGQWYGDSGAEQNSTGVALKNKRKYGGFVSAPKMNDIPDHPALVSGAYPILDPSTAYLFYQWVQAKF